MNVGVAHSEVNPNTRVMNSRGIWLAYVISVGVLHVVLLSIPFFSIPVVWTLTNVIHNLVSQSLASLGSVSLGYGQAPGFGEGKAGGLALLGVILAQETAAAWHRVRVCRSDRLPYTRFPPPLPLERAGHVFAAAHSEGDPL